MMKNFFNSGSTVWRLARTLAEVVLAWVITYLPDMIGLIDLSAEVKTIMISFLTMLFTAILGMVKKGDEDDTDICD